MTATASQALEEWVLFSWQMCTDVCSMQWTGDESLLEEVKIQTLSLPYLLKASPSKLSQICWLKWLHSIQETLEWRFDVKKLIECDA